MDVKPKTYHSVHDYLDVLFEGKNPSESDIVEAKKTYWRAYNSKLKKAQRQNKKTVSVSFSNAEAQNIQKYLSKKQSISAFIKQLVLDTVSFETPINNQQAKLLASIEQQLFLLVEYLEALLFQSDRLDRHQIRTIEKHLQTLQNLFQKLFS